MMGINIRVESRTGADYADLILAGVKTLESRQSNSLKPYIGQRVAIVRTGAGEAFAIGEVTVGEPIIVDEDGFCDLVKAHLVAPGSQFFIKPGTTKHLYPMLDPVRYASPKKVGKGIIARKVLED